MKNEAASKNDDPARAYRTIALEQQSHPGYYGEFKSNPKYCTPIGALAIEERELATDIYQLEWKRKWKLGKFGTKSCVLIKGNTIEI